MVPNGAVLGKTRRRISLGRIREMTREFGDDVVAQYDAVGNITLWERDVLVAVIDTLYESIARYRWEDNLPPG